LLNEIQRPRFHSSEWGNTIGLRAIADKNLLATVSTIREIYDEKRATTPLSFSQSSVFTARPQARYPVCRPPFGLILLGQVAWVGLALSLTAGFAVGQSLVAGRPALDPGSVHACALFFAWSAMLLGSSWNS
jgi:hypothetical protein